MTQQRSQSKYVVANPRGIPKGLPILRFGEQSFFEGDTWLKPPKMLKSSEAEWIEKGFLVPKGKAESEVEDNG